MFDSELLIEKSRHRILHRILDLPARTFIHDEEGVRSQAGMTARHVGTELSVIGELQSVNSGNPKYGPLPGIPRLLKTIRESPEY